MRQPIAEDFKIIITTYDQKNSIFIFEEKIIGKYTLATAIEKVTDKYEKQGFKLRTNNYSLSGVKWINSNGDAIEILPFIKKQNKINPKTITKSLAYL